ERQDTAQFEVIVVGQVGALGGEPVGDAARRPSGSDTIGDLEHQGVATVGGGQHQDAVARLGGIQNLGEQQSGVGDTGATEIVHQGVGQLFGLQAERAGNVGD